MRIFIISFVLGFLPSTESSSLRVLEKGSLKNLIGKGFFKFGLIDGDKGKARMQHTTGLGSLRRWQRVCSKLKRSDIDFLEIVLDRVIIIS
jgi:hypothetical protein